MKKVKKEPKIIHISGPSGSGKTTLGNKLKEEFGNKIIVKDIDDLRQEFINKYYKDKKWTIIDKKAYQEYIDKYVNKQLKNNKPIIFVGLNNMPWFHKNHYYNMHSTYNFCIKINDTIIIKQKCLRLLNNISNDKMAMNDLIDNNEKFIKLFKRALDNECNLKKTEKMNNKWNKDYKLKKYKFIPRDKIFIEVSKIINQ